MCSAIPGVQGNTGGHANGAYTPSGQVHAHVLQSNVDTIQSYYDTVLSIWTGSVEPRKCGVQR